MEYPLNLQLAAPAIGFAVANDESEHIALSDMGYQPAFVADTSEVDASGKTVDSVRAELDALGIAYSKRLGLARLTELLPA